jgi:hypothetical protein
MKKLIAIFSLIKAIATLLATAVPAFADSSKGTGVTIQAGAGTNPLVKAKWEISGGVTDETGDPRCKDGGRILLELGLWYYVIEQNNSAHQRKAEPNAEGREPSEPTD